jgi:hypothetical protein
MVIMKTDRTKKKTKKSKRIMSVDEFIENQLSRYIKIHKRHEKEINYIG